MTTTDPCKHILAALRAAKPPMDFSELNTGFTHAVLTVCNAIEESAQPEELWESGERANELTREMNIGRHLAATRRFFGLVG